MGFEPQYPVAYLPLSGGTITGSLTVTGAVDAGPNAAPLPVQEATTAVAGAALQNGTPTFATWTAPSDGKLHRVEIWTFLNVTSAETGGQVEATVTPPNGTPQTFSMFAPNKAAGTYHGDGVNFGDLWGLMVEAGTTLTIAQTSALTAGAATIWAEIWGS